jgi:hypothetical protein
MAPQEHFTACIFSKSSNPNRQIVFYPPLAISQFNSAYTENKNRMLLRSVVQHPFSANLLIPNLQIALPPACNQQIQIGIL